MVVDLVWIILFVLFLPLGGGLLFPRDSINREVKELAGLWHFRADFSINRNEGFENEWYKQPLSKTGDVQLMPVPSSFNDITTDPYLRDFVGWVWYERQFWLPRSWANKETRIMLRFGCAHYNAIAWMNGAQVTEHSGGHLPFEGDITPHALFGVPNTLTVAVNNTLGPHTLPAGSLSFFDSMYPKGYFVQNFQMDFFNYAGLHRPVRLYTTPSSVHLDDITTTSSINSDNSATLHYSLKVGGSYVGEAVANVTLLGRGGVVATVIHTFTVCHDNEDCSMPVLVSGTLDVVHPDLWWPWTMSSTPGFLYSFQVTLTAGEVEDQYRLPVGIRTVEVKDTQFLINKRPFYFHGFGKHEDADIRGKGLDYPLLMKDLNLLLWLGANSIRTSHYPYSEEQMQLCDKYGIVVIDETPAVGLKIEENFADETLKHHKTVIKELVERDKNNPSVVMWSLANEPKTSLHVADNYFKTLSNVARELDPTRPITIASKVTHDVDFAMKYMDVICLNKYYGWYRDPGHPESIHWLLPNELENWHSHHKKPIIITEYGAEALAGIHEQPAVMFSEEYQVELLSHMFQVFDKYRERFLVGEMVWTFADFETAQKALQYLNGNASSWKKQKAP